MHELYLNLLHNAAWESAETLLLTLCCSPIRNRFNYSLVKSQFVVLVPAAFAIFSLFQIHFKLKRARTSDRVKVSLKQSHAK